MKVMIKMTRGGNSEINAEPTDTIHVVKTKIKESPAPLGFAVDSQKIICEGKVLKDDGTLESYGFSENTKNKYLVLMVKQNNLPPTVTSSFSMPTPPTNTAIISSTEPGPSSGILTPRPVQPFSQSSTVNQLQSTSQTTQIAGNTTTISSTEPGPSNSGILTPRPVQPFSQSSTVNQLQSTSQTAQIAGNTTTISSTEPGPSNSGILTPRPVQPSSQLQSTLEMAQIAGVGSDGDQKVLATLQGSEIDDFEQLKAMGFPEQATIAAYLSCGKNVEHAAMYLSENGNAVANGRRAEMYGVDSNGDKKLLATFEGSEVDDIEALEALGFSQKATVEAYLLCDREKERAASFLIENGDDSPSSDSESTNNVSELIGSLDGSDFEQIQQLETLGFPHAVALAAYLACKKNAQLAASVLIECGAELNLGSDNGPAISNTPLALPSPDDSKTSPTPVSEISGSSLIPSQKSLGKRPERPSWSLYSDDDRTSKKTKTSEISTATSSMSFSMPSFPPASFLTEVSPTSEPTPSMSFSKPSSPPTSFLTEVSPTSEPTPSLSFSMSSPPTSFVTEVSSTSEPMIIDDSELEDSFNNEEKATINKLEEMGFPREAVIEAICICNGDEGCIVEYLYEKGYEI